ncbi:MAG: hypothetical protein LBK66_07420 [Spirochaetaceae bacterium]|jgi:hypothetical protein|nr:hypothetical protein [Spirochaetaceae bacterium]
MSFFLILMLLLLIIFIAVLTSVLMAQSRRVKRWIYIVLLVFAVGGGFFFYSYGYLSSGTSPADALLVALRGIIRTARMFTLNNDYGELVNEQGAQWMRDHLLPQIVFWLCQISALVIVQAALLSLFGWKLINWIRLHLGLHREMYLIKGGDKYALMLGENIATQDNPQRPPKKEGLVVFLIEDDDDEKKIREKTAHFGGIVQVLDKKHDISHYLGLINPGKWNRRRRKYYVVFTQKDTSAPEDIQLTVEFAKEKAVDPKNLDIFVLASSEWDQERIEAITQAKKGGHRKYPYTIHIINEVDLLARQMIETHPPFECPGLNFNETTKTGIAARDFTVMILGFGTAGQHALLRLIMNGQFVGSRMRAIVVDREIEHLRERFLHRYPSLGICCKIYFKNFDVRDKAFFELLKEINTIDYIVAALGDDGMSRQAALDIRLCYERKGTALPLVAVYEENGSLHDAGQNEKVFSFGCREAIYKEAVIIREETDRMARIVHEVYGGNPPWQELDWILQESNRASADFIPAMLRLAGLSGETARKQQALTNDPDLAETLAKTEHLRWNAFHAAMGFRPISIEEMRQRFEKYDGEKNTRAHLDFCRRDSKERLQVCLVIWDELDEITQVYRELARKVDNVDEMNRDFKKNDRSIIKSIPNFLRAAKEKKDATP